MKRKSVETKPRVRQTHTKSWTASPCLEASVCFDGSGRLSGPTGDSIKAVLPALVPTLSYDNLAIGDGETASHAFEHMTAHPKEDHSELRRQMREYCKVDTVGMVRVVEALQLSISRWDDVPVSR